MFVEEKAHDKLIDKLVAMNKKRKVGDPFDPATEQGPQVDKAQFDKIMHYVEAGKKEGAKCVTGGARVGERVVVSTGEAESQEPHGLLEVAMACEPRLKHLRGAREAQRRNANVVTGAHREDRATVELCSVGDEVSDAA